MGWHQDINLENFIATSAPYGGPIAIRRDEQKFIKVQGSGQPIISIFSGSGKQITSFKVGVLSFFQRDFGRFVVDEETHCLHGVVERREVDFYSRGRVGGFA
mgnify:FL=1